MRPDSSSGRPAKGTQRAAFHEAGRLVRRAAPAKRPRPQFAIVAQRCRRCGCLALLCSLGFRLAASPTGGARLRPRHTRFVRLAGRSVVCYTSPNEEEPIAPVTRWVPPARWAADSLCPMGMMDRPLSQCGGCFAPPKRMRSNFLHKRPMSRSTGAGGMVMQPAPQDRTYPFGARSGGTVPHSGHMWGDSRLTMAIPQHSH